jgi:hypothetical protein
MIAAERSDPSLLLRRRNRKVRAEEQRPRQEGRDVVDEARITSAGDQPLAHDDVRLQQLHGDEGERLVMVEHRWHQLRHQAGLVQQRQMFVVRTRQRQRPALADEAHIGQRLLDGNSAVAAAHDEDEIEIAVADFADGPVGRRSTQPRGDRGKPRQVVAQIRLTQNTIFVLPGCIQRSLV